MCGEDLLDIRWGQWVRRECSSAGVGALGGFSQLAEPKCPGDPCVHQRCCEGPKLARRPRKEPAARNVAIGVARGFHDIERHIRKMVAQQLQARLGLFHMLGQQDRR